VKFKQFLRDLFVKIETISYFELRLMDLWVHGSCRQAGKPPDIHRDRLWRGFGCEWRNRL